MAVQRYNRPLIIIEQKEYVELDIQMVCLESLALIFLRRWETAKIGSFSGYILNKMTEKLLIG